MKYKIGLIPAVIEKYKYNHICVDLRLINFIKECFPDSNIRILKDTLENGLDKIISSGGNDLKQLSKEKRNIMRHKLEDYYLRLSIKKRIKFYGICFGAQFIAKKFGARLIKDSRHVSKNHKIKHYKNNKTYLVNSYHNFKIEKFSNNKLKAIYFSEDGSIEAFRHKNLKIAGIMWHPERFRKIRKFDLNFVREII